MAGPNSAKRTQAGFDEESAVFNDTERAVLALAEQVVAGPKVAGGTIEELKETLGSRQVVELLMTIGNYLSLARLMTALEIEVDESIGNTVVELSRDLGAG